MVFSNCARPSVVLSDQAKGMARALEDTGWNTRVFHQLCEWHIFGNVKKRILESRRYEKPQQAKLYTLVWSWIQATTATELE